MCALFFLFLDLLKKNPSRVVNVSSALASLNIDVNLNELPKYQGHMHQYKLSKLCQILFTIEFARRFTGTSITTYSVHPGVIKTNIFRILRNWQTLILNCVNALIGKVSIILIR